MGTLGRNNFTSLQGRTKSSQQGRGGITATTKAQAEDAVGRSGSRSGLEGEENAALDCDDPEVPVKAERSGRQQLSVILRV